jgi:hypothetical protein
MLRRRVTTPQRIRAALGGLSSSRATDQRPPGSAPGRCKSSANAIGVALLALSTWISRPAFAAAQCVPGSDVDSRYAEIVDALARGRPAARLWWIAWTTTYSTATVGQGVLAAVTHDRGTRIDSIVGAAESGIGAIGMLLAAPRTPMWASDELQAMDGSTLCARLRRLRRAEELLHKSASEERQARSWYSQLIGDAINLAAPLVLWLGYGRHASGWYTLGPGVAVQQAQILTQPTDAIGAWSSYQRRARDVGPSLTIVPIPGGAALTGSF